MLDVLIAHDDGQGQMVEFLGSDEVEGERQPFVFHVQFLGEDLSAGIACGKCQCPVGIRPIRSGHIHAYGARAACLILNASIFQVGTDAPFVGQLTSPAKGDGIIRPVESATVGVTVSLSILEIPVVVILH